MSKVAAVQVPGADSLRVTLPYIPFLHLHFLLPLVDGVGVSSQSGMELASFRTIVVYPWQKFFFFSSKEEEKTRESRFNACKATALLLSVRTEVKRAMAALEIEAVLKLASRSTTCALPAKTLSGKLR